MKWLRNLVGRDFLGLYPHVDLFAVYGNLFRCIHTDTNLVPFTPSTVTVTSSPIIRVSPTRRVKISIRLLLYPVLYLYRYAPLSYKDTDMVNG